MKKIFILSLMLFAYQLFSYGQENVSLDQMLVNINKSSVTSGIIYEREAPFANLYRYNSKLDTADIFYFEQAEMELYNASNQTKFISNDALRLLYAPASQKNVVDIGILNSQYQFLNYDSANPSLGGLTLSNNLFYQISGKPPFLSSVVTMIAPLKEDIVGTSFTYNFKASLWLTNGTKTIKTVSADLGDGVVRNVIVNGSITSPTVTVTYSQSGYKYLKFTVTFSDNSTHITYGKIYAKVLSTIHTNYMGEITDDFTLTASIPFQGYDETAPTYAQIQYRIFYSTNNTQRKLMNPVIVSDGFDPQDKRKIEASDYILYNPLKDRSIEDMMKYKDCNGDTANLIQVLNQKGYDVVIVNYPTYNSTTTGKEINGGADFIERNAMGMVALIQKLNTTLAANGSTKQLAVVGPSMGGQITRYALAYMEKQYAATGDPKWLHKTRLWISIDSPHLGANIPEGLQALVNLTKKSSPTANDFYNKQLGSPAAKQQLINWHQEGPTQTGTTYYDVNTADLNGRTVSQGWPTNSGSTFYQQFYNNQFGNGLPNSKGYPMNLRKIALVNGSVTGKTYGTDGQQTLNVRTFTNICAIWCWDVHVASFETYAMPTYGTDHNITRFKKAFTDRHTHAPNNDSRGNVDILPGGSYPGYDILDQSIMGTFPGTDYTAYFPFYIGFTKGSFFASTRFNSGSHCFIPSFSALGMKNPNQNWAQSLKRNLVCSNEIPFDSYFGHDINTQHTSFDCESVNWLLKELDGTPQAPWFPLTGDDLSGPATLCLNTTSPYNFASLCSIPSAATWSISSNLQQVSSTTTSITVKAISGGNTGTITATFTNGEKVVKTINVGAPTVYAKATNKYSCSGTYQTWSLSADPVIGSNWYWSLDHYLKTGSDLYIDQSSASSTLMDISGSAIVKLSYTDACGVAAATTTYIYSTCPGKRIHNIVPNPASSKITVSVKNENNKTNTSQDLMYAIKITDRFGISRKSVTYKPGVSSTTITIADLIAGTYLVSIFDGKEWSSEKLIVQK